MPVITRRDLLTAGALLIAPGTPGAAAPLPRNMMLHGRGEPEPELIELAAGPLTMSFQPDIGFLRYVAYGDREVLRGVYAAVRDRSWGTVAPRISNIRLDRSPQAFDLTFDVECIEGGIDFAWKGVLHGSAGGSVRFSMDGVARSAFLRNRIGFCVLHPMRECASQPCVIEHTAGRREEGRFPDLISPHQPYQDIRAITHPVMPGLSATVRFEGDVFEMEDHRNWTDSNFKTYCTPLDRPYPVRVEKGMRIIQAVTLMVEREAAAPVRRVSRTDPVRLELSVDRRRLPQPQIGFGLGAGEPTEDDAKRLRLLKPAHLRVDIHLACPDWKTEFARALRVSSAIAAPLECAVFVTGDARAQLAALAAEASRTRANVARFLVLHENEASTDARWIRMARKRLPGGSSLASGTDQYFTELNRGRPQADLLDALCYSINPQVHAFDNASLIENLEAQAETVRTARSFAVGRPIAVTPVTLRPRSNPDPDPRQRSLFGAVWTLGSIKYLAESEAASITYYELTGPAGLMARSVFPLYHAFAAVADFAGGGVLPVRSSDSLRVEALMLSSGNRQRLMVANMTARRQRVLLPEPLPAAFRLRRLDITTFAEATESPDRWRASSERSSGTNLLLGPYSLVIADF